MNLLLSLLIFFQGVKLTEDFLPLAAGNQWVYDVSNASGQKLDALEFVITDRTIVSGRSVYTVSGFPFAGGSGDAVRMIGYDREGKQFIRVSGNREVSLFSGESESTVLQSDASGIPQKIELSTGTTTLVLQRGVGIVEARLRAIDGTHILKLASSRFGKPAGGTVTSTTAPSPLVPPVRSTVSTVAPVTAENPVLVLSAEPDPAGIKLTLVVSNTSDKLLPFKFNSSKTHDFIITDPATGVEVWRQSHEKMYAQVIRSDSIRAKSNWTYSEIWNRKDNDRNPVPPGKYLLVGILSAQPEIKADPITIEIR